MTLEAQLLQIIEQQQEQLKQQQKQQESALQRLEAQSKTITQFESYSSELAKYSKTLNERNTELEQIIQKLRNPQLSESLLVELEGSLKQRLESHLMQLVSGLRIERQAKELLAKNLPSQVQAEINAQLKPLNAQIIEKMTSVEAYQQKLALLIQQVSSRL